MAMLVLGLVIFLGLHSTRIVGEGGREKAIARLGEGPWKGVYSCPVAHRLRAHHLGFRAGALDRAAPLVAAGLGAAYGADPDADQLHPARRLYLQEEPFRGRCPPPDGVGRRDLGGGSPPRQRLRRRSPAVRRLPHLGGGRPRQLLWPRRPQFRRLSGARMGRDGRGDRSGVVVWIAFLAGVHRWLFGVSPLAM